MLPPKNDLKWEEGMHCEDDTIQPACVKSFPGDRYPWRVGRSPTLIAAEWMWAGQIHKTLLYERNGDGKPTRQVELNQYGQVVTARMFVEDGKYSEREPNGANALSRVRGFMTYELDDRGFSVRRNCVQWNGSGMHDTHNVGGHKYARDKNGFVLSDRERRDRMGSRWSTRRACMRSATSARPHREDRPAKMYFDDGAGCARGSRRAGAGALKTK